MSHGRPWPCLVALSRQSFRLNLVMVEGTNEDVLCKYETPHLGVDAGASCARIPSPFLLSQALFEAANAVRKYVPCPAAVVLPSPRFETEGPRMGAGWPRTLKQERELLSLRAALAAEPPGCRTDTLRVICLIVLRWRAARPTHAGLLVLLWAYHVSSVPRSEDARHAWQLFIPFCSMVCKLCMSCVWTIVSTSSRCCGVDPL